MSVAVEVQGPDNKVARALEDLASPDDGSILAQDVVDAARPEGSPLHSHFTWDDSIAADAYRVEQARRLIRSYKVHVVSDKASGKERDLLVRGFVAGRSVRRGGPSGTYLPSGSLTPKEQAVLVLRMKREIASLKLRYGHLEQFWAMIHELAEQAPEK